MHPKPRIKMNHFGIVFAIAFAMSVALAEKAATGPSPTEARMKQNAGVSVPVELEWEQIAGAKFYELEFQNLEGKVLQTFKSDSHIFKFKFRVGSYFVRSRVADSRRVYGEWSAISEFAVKPKPALITEKSARTNGKINPKTLTSEVQYQWGEAPGASFFRLKIIDERGEIIREVIVKEFAYKTDLKAGTYTTTLTSVNEKGIESEAVTLPGNVVIETVQLPRPEIVFEEFPDPENPKQVVKRLPQTEGVFTLRWKSSSLSETTGILEYRYFFSDEWLPIQNFNSKTAKEIILDKSKKPGRYRITVWAEAKGLVKSEPTTYEFITKPTEY